MNSDLAMGERFLPDNSTSSAFDYAQLDAETRSFVQQNTKKIKTLVKRSAQDVIDIGNRLIEVKERLGHGQYGAWLMAEFEWSQDTAERFVNVAKKFQNPQFADFSFAPSALYLLAAPSAPEEAVTEALDRAAAGEEITHKTAQVILKAARGIRTQRSKTKKREKEVKRQEVLARYDDVALWDGKLKANTISLCSICDLQLPSESVDMVFTDPPYHDEYIHLYEHLARVSRVALKPGGYLMAYAGKMFIPEIIKHLSARLEYVSIYAVFQPFSQARIVKHNLFENWRPILVFKKPGKTEVKEWAQDVVRGTRDKSHHEWQQDSEAPLQYIAAYTKPGDLVLDPFVGGGTTPWSCKQLGRYYVCFDDSVDAVKLSTERVTNG